MKSLFYLGLALLFSLSVPAQDLSEASFRSINNRLLNTRFDNFTVEPILEQNPELGQNCRSLMMMVLFDGPRIDSVLKESLFRRLQEIARLHHQKGKSLIIIGPGARSFERAYKLNRERKERDLFYVSFGNTCTSTSLYLEAVEHFNRTTLALRTGIHQAKAEKQAKPHHGVFGTWELVEKQCLQAKDTGRYYPSSTFIPRPKSPPYTALNLDSSGTFKISQFCMKCPLLEWRGRFEIDSSDQLIFYDQRDSTADQEFNGRLRLLGPNSLEIMDADQCLHIYQRYIEP